MAAALVLSARCSVLAAGPDAKEVIDKAVNALGGEAKITALEGKIVETKAKGKVNFGGNEGEISTTTITMGLGKYRQDFKGDLGGNEIKGVTVMDGDKAWRKFAGDTSKLEDDQLANQKRAVYLSLVPAVILPLKGKDFKVESTKEEKVDNKPAVALKIVGPDKKDFELFFDKETGLPVKMLATVNGFGGDEFTQETTYGKYKDFNGVKRATKIENKRNGEKFLDIEITDIKVLDKADPKTFAEPPAD
ncbi:MAG TPA: hypothetical protein VEI07_06655 [Planctomycetaceae bacterium]|nr:hypothetical protein [Planctomycetaceae bacterium]